MKNMISYALKAKRKRQLKLLDSISTSEDTKYSLICNRIVLRTK